VYQAAAPGARNGNNNNAPRLELAEEAKKKAQMKKQAQKSRVRPSL
jgi:hypothetical protein